MPIRFLALLIYRTSFALAFATPAGPYEIVTITETALEGFEPSVREQIEEALDRARTNPQQADAIGNLGMILHAYEHYELAIPCYESAMKLDPEDFIWPYYLALAHSAVSSDPTQLTRLWRLVLERAPDHFPSRLRLAQTLIDANALEESREICLELLRERPRSARVHYILGRVLVVIGEKEKALEHLQAACAIAPRYGPAHYSLAMLYRDLGQREKAVEHLAHYQVNQASVPPLDDPLADALEAVKRGAVHHVNEGKRLQDAGQLQQAAAEYHRALELNPRLIQPHVNLISIYGTMDDFERAAHHYRQALEINSSLAEVHYNYGILLSHQSRFEEAEGLFRKALEINPFLSDAHNNLGYTLERLGRLDEAEASFRKALENRPDHREAHLNMGRILQRQGRDREAIPHFTRVLSVHDERTPVAGLYLAYAYARIGEFDQARKQAQAARHAGAEFSQSELIELIDRLLKQIPEPKHPQ